MKPFQLLQPSSLASASRHLRTGKAQLKAGGIDLLDLLKERLIAPDLLVNLGALKGLDAVQLASSGALHLGPSVTLDALATHPSLQQRFRAIAQGADAIATPQIRNLATLAGNLCQRPRCWYFRSGDFDCAKKGGGFCYAQTGESQYHALFSNSPCAIVHPSTMAVPLIAFGASLRIANESSQRRVALDKFFVLPSQSLSTENVLKTGEVITEIAVPAPAAGTRSLYLKLMAKQSFDWPLAELAIVGKVSGRVFSDLRVVLGAIAPVPLRATTLEQALTGKSIDRTLVKAAWNTFARGATPLAKNRYKLALFETLLGRALDTLVKEAS